MYDGLIKDLIFLIFMIAGFIGVMLLALEYINDCRETVHYNIWNDLNLWQKKMHTDNIFPEEFFMLFDIPDKKRKDQTLITYVYYNDCLAFKIMADLKYCITGRKLKKRIMNADYYKIITKAYNIYTEKLLNKL